MSLFPIIKLVYNHYSNKSTLSYKSVIENIEINNTSTNKYNPLIKLYTKPDGCNQIMFLFIGNLDLYNLKRDDEFDLVQIGQYLDKFQADYNLGKSAHNFSNISDLNKFFGVNILSAWGINISNQNSYKGLYFIKHSISPMIQISEFHRKIPTLIKPIILKTTISNQTDGKLEENKLLLYSSSNIEDELIDIVCKYILLEIKKFSNQEMNDFEKLIENKYPGQLNKILDRIEILSKDYDKEQFLEEDILESILFELDII